MGAILTDEEVYGGTMVLVVDAYSAPVSVLNLPILVASGASEWHVFTRLYIYYIQRRRNIALAKRNGFGGRILPDAATSWPPDRPKYFDHARCITHALGGRAIVDRQAPNPKSAGVECGALAAIVR
ncbi:hypothetical protein ACCO45_013235 [Purpureocillium lilacinum]|uniref:Uncharacterized protein n=1 Tax=Purpureocillium lilacinum TaxID=33203 RepID=A0ACC4DAW7_PURLI